MQIQRYFSTVTLVAVGIGTRIILLDLEHLPSAAFGSLPSHVLLMFIEKRLHSKIAYLNFSDLLLQSVEFLVGGLHLGVA